MKFTASKDGQFRCDIRIKVRIGLTEMIDGLGYFVSRDPDHDIDAADNKAMAVESALKKFKSRKAIVDATLSAIRLEGDSVWTWADDCKWSEELREQARVLIAKKFPEVRHTAAKLETRAQ